MKRARFVRARTLFHLGTSLLLWVLTVSLMAAPRPQPSEQVGPGYDIEMSRMIPMRDGVELEAWIFKPSHLKSRAPAVLEFTQYDIQLNIMEGQYESVTS